jgi:hypothetical protein
MKVALAVLALVGVTLDARALGSLADVEIFDRDTGAVLPTYRHHGEYWVAGRPGARFSITIHNRGNDRILAVTAVDGVNVISGETAAWLQTGYVFDPREGYDIPGWRKSQSEVADFNFTTASDSYAARTDRPANVGVIGVAVFLEQKPKVAAVVPKQAPSADASRLSDVPAPAAAPPDVSSRRAEAGSLAQSARSAIAQNFARAAPKLGTGHGAREVNYVHDVPFNRASSTPNEIIHIRYDSLENLIAMGVVNQRTTPWPTPNPFPDSPDQRYVPDPPGG